MPINEQIDNQSIVKTIFSDNGKKFISVEKNTVQLLQ